MLKNLNLSMRQLMSFSIALLSAIVVTLLGGAMTAQPGMAVSQPTQEFSGMDLTLPQTMPSLSLTHQDPNFY